MLRTLLYIKTTLRAFSTYMVGLAQKKKKIKTIKQIVFIINKLFFFYN